MEVQVVVSHDGDCGKSLTQFVYQSHQRRFLQQGARVFGMSLLVQSTFVADAYGVCVVALAVCTRFLQWASRPNGAIHGDIEVITNWFKASLAVPTVDILHRYTLPRQGGTAVDDEEGTSPTPSPPLYADQPL